MTPQEKVLALLAKEWDAAGPPGIMDIREVIAALPIAPNETMTALRALYTTGLLDMNKFKTSVFLTPDGYAKATGQDH